MKDRNGTGTDGVPSTLRVVTRRPAREKGLERLLQAINSFPRLCVDGVDFKPLWLVTEPSEQPKLRLVRE